MVPRLRVKSSRLPLSTMLSAAICVLLIVGILTTLSDAVHVKNWELKEANQNGQRIIIDPVNGAVSGLPNAAPAFEVVTGEEEAASDVATPEPVETPEPATVSILPDDVPALRTEPNAAGLPDMPASGDSLVPPLAPEITEKIDGESLPKRGDKGVTPASLYSKALDLDPKKASLSIVITDAGFSSAVMMQIAKLPRDVTVVFSPYALDANKQVALLHMGGYETWGMLPAQGARYPQDDPGPLGIISGTDAKFQMKRLHQVMSATLGAVGLVLPPDETMTTQPDFAGVLGEIDARGLYVLSTHPNRTIEQITGDAEKQKIFRRADMVLDSTASAAFIQSKLAGLKALAVKQRELIVVAQARPQTLALLANWLAKNPLGNEVALVPLSAMYYAAEATASEPVTTKSENGSGKGEGGGH